MKTAVIGTIIKCEGGEDGWLDREVESVVRLTPPPTFLIILFFMYIFGK